MADEDKARGLSPYDFDRLLRSALALLSSSYQTGTATGGSQTTLQDTSKDWRTDVWVPALIKVIIDSIEYVRLVSSNTTDTITFDALPAGTSVASGNKYSVARTLDIADITNWGGTALTGRDISLDLKTLTDDSIKGLLKSIGDIAALQNLITRIGQTTDAIVAAGATGSLAAKLRRVTQGLQDLKTLIVLAAGTAVIGKVRLVTTAGHEITDDTADAGKALLVAADGTDAIGGVQATPAVYTLLRRLKDLLTGIVLAAGTAVIGKVQPTGESLAGQSITGVSVEATTTVVLAANANRKAAIFVNDSDETIYLAVGVSAEMNKGIRLNAHGGSFTMSSKLLSLEAVNGICSSGSKVCTVQEFVAA